MIAVVFLLFITDNTPLRDREYLTFCNPFPCSGIKAKHLLHRRMIHLGNTIHCFSEYDCMLKSGILIFRGGLGRTGGLGSGYHHFLLLILTGDRDQ
ncbi:hypothetical protein SDC9_179820 [bioreactor metagenome]|uniref:Uncharacterized protein n=1 Tax=bioreactor metagenome TaxID=1076179 RepID=A0A645H1W8_9ZZZZ